MILSTVFVVGLMLRGLVLSLRVYSIAVRILLMFRYILAALCAVMALNCAFAQGPIPSGGPDGFIQGSYGVPIVIDAFYDFLCPDSAEMNTNFAEVQEFYGDQMQFVMHTFPLPYHRNAFLVAQGANVVKNISGTTNVFNYMNQMFKVQNQFSTSATANFTMNKVINMIGNAAVDAGVIDSKKQMVDGLAYGNQFDSDTRTSWKYGCSRSVIGTPTMLVNGVYVAAQATWGLTEWQAVLGGLTPNTTCPSGQESCEYIPGQYQCCLSGEACIPNVGCRC
jgi:hypothetical protein